MLVCSTRGLFADAAIPKVTANAVLKMVCLAFISFSLHGHSPGLAAHASNTMAAVVAASVSEPTSFFRLVRARA